MNDSIENKIEDIVGRKHVREVLLRMGDNEGDFTVGCHRFIEEPLLEEKAIEHIVDEPYVFTQIKPSLLHKAIPFLSEESIGASQQNRDHFSNDLLCEIVSQGEGVAKGIHDALLANGFGYDDIFPCEKIVGEDIYEQVIPHGEGCRYRVFQPLYDMDADNDVSGDEARAEETESDIYIVKANRKFPGLADNLDQVIIKGNVSLCNYIREGIFIAQSQGDTMGDRMGNGNRIDISGINLLSITPDTVTKKSIEIDAGNRFPLNEFFQISREPQPLVTAFQNSASFRDEMQARECRVNPLLFKSLDKPSLRVQEVAIEVDPFNIKYIDDPSRHILKKALEKDCSILESCSLTDDKLVFACETMGSAIVFIKDPTPEMQLAAFKQNEDSLAFIEKPCDELWELINERNNEMEP